MLKHCQGWSLAEIGRHLDRSPAAVASLLQRGLKQLRETPPGFGVTFDDRQVPRNRYPTTSALAEVIAAYLQAVEAGPGARPRRARSFRHPELAAELTEFFADQDQFDRLMSPFRGSAPPTPFPASTAGAGVQPGGASRGITSAITS